MNVDARIDPTVTIREAALRRWDAVVIGAGPAGSLAARTLALAGRSVLLVDKSEFPRSKVCGCCLSGAALDALERAGLGGLVQGLGGVVLERLRIHTGSASATIPSRGICISRERLDAALVHQAIRAGAEFLPGVVGGVRVEDEAGVRGPVIRKAGATDTHTLSAEVALVADGLAGTALRGCPAQVSSRAKIGLSAVIDGPFEPGLVRMACARDGYVGAVRLEDGRLNIAAAINPAFVRAAGGAPGAVAAILASCGLESPAGLHTAQWQGAPALTRRRWPIAWPGVIVLGDAAGYAEPFTGEGIGWAMAAGIAAAELVAGGRRESEWPRVYARLIARRQRTCRWVAGALRNPGVTAALVRAVGAIPGSVAPLVRMVHGPIPGAAP